MNKLKLSRPITINDVELTELEYDFEALTGGDIMALNKRLTNEGITITIRETDGQYLDRLFFMAVRKANPVIDYPDLRRIAAIDLIRAEGITRSFLLGTGSDE